MSGPDRWPGDLASGPAHYHEATILLGGTGEDIYRGAVGYLADVRAEIAAKSPEHATLVADFERRQAEDIAPLLAAVAPVEPEPVPEPSAPEPPVPAAVRHRKCGYLVTAPGHALLCLGSVRAVVPEPPPTLREIILDALADAIDYRAGKYGPWCRDCRNSPVDHCAAHERDYRMAVLYQEAQARIRAADREDTLDGGWHRDRA